MTGPFKDEGAARRAAHTALPPDPSRGILTSAENLQMLERVLGAAHVEAGAYDYRVLTWLSGYEDSTVAVICGLVERAYAAGRAAGGGAR